MPTRSSYSQPEWTRLPEPTYVPNEVVVTTVQTARNDDLPHFLNVAAGVAPSATSFGETSIDGVLHRPGLPTQSRASTRPARLAARSPLRQYRLPWPFLPSTKTASTQETPILPRLLLSS